MAKFTAHEMLAARTHWHGSTFDLLFEHIDALESELAEAKRPMKLGPCGLHPKAFWTRTYHCEGTQPFGPDKCVMEGHNHDYCTVCAEIAKRESEHQQAIQLERAAILREAASHRLQQNNDDFMWCTCGWESGTSIESVIIERWKEHLLSAIPTDQPALDRHDAELRKKWEDEIDAKLSKGTSSCPICGMDLNKEVDRREEIAKLKTESYQRGVADGIESVARARTNNE